MSAVVYGSRYRALRYAALFSLALHALLLFGLSPQRAPAPADAAEVPIVARLVQPPAPERQSRPKPKPSPPVVKKPPAAVAKKPPAPLAKKPPRPVLKKPPPPVARPEAEVAPEPAPPPPVPTAPAVEPVQPAPPPAAAAPEPEPAPRALPAPPAPESLDDGSLVQYRRQIYRMALKYKRYPRAAMDNNWEGEVVVRMVVDANGGIAAMTIHTSSGHEVLDRQALEMFRRAKPLVVIPPALRGREFAVELRAIYNLEDRGSG